MALFTQEEKNFIKLNYGVMTNKEIGLHLGRPAHSIKSAAYRIGVQTVPIGTSKNSRRQIQYVCDENFFSTYTPESCYWAGFIAADGCIHTKISDSHTKRLKIELNSVDIGHLEKFKTDIKFTGPISERDSRTVYVEDSKSTKRVCAIVVTSNKICDDLEKNFNITPRKSLTLKPPTHIICDEHILYFIKGYIDGDGSLSKPKSNGAWGCGLSALGTFEMITWMVQNLSQICEIQFSEKSIYQRKNKMYIGHFISHIQNLEKLYLN